MSLQHIVLTLNKRSHSIEGGCGYLINLDLTKVPFMENLSEIKA